MCIVQPICDSISFTNRSIAAAAATGQTPSSGLGGISSSDYQQIKLALGQTEADIAVYQDRAARMRKRLSRMRSLAAKVPDTEIELARLNRDYGVLKGKHTELLSRREQARMSQDRAAGAELLQACREIGGCPTGSAVSTAAFALETAGVRRVIHAVGPRWRDGSSGEHDLLRGAYRSSLEIAEQEGAASIAFPSISTGVYGFPVDQAAQLALQTAGEFLRETEIVRDIRFVLFDADTYGHFGRALRTL